MFRKLTLVRGCAGGIGLLLKRNIITAARQPLSEYRKMQHTYASPVSWKRPFAAASTDGHDIPQEILELSNEKYHHESDSFLENLQDELEDLSDQYPDKIPDIEYTQGVMTLQVDGIGTYVINKQPPNKQIWLSSPISGPNRFDFYQEEWISLRDGSKLLETLNQEMNDAIPQEQGKIAL